MKGFRSLCYHFTYPVMHALVLVFFLRECYRVKIHFHSFVGFRRNMCHIHGFSFLSYRRHGIRKMQIYTTLNVSEDQERNPYSWRVSWENPTAILAVEGMAGNIDGGRRWERRGEGVTWCRRRSSRKDEQWSPQGTGDNADKPFLRPSSMPNAGYVRLRADWSWHQQVVAVAVGIWQKGR